MENYGKGGSRSPTSEEYSPPRRRFVSEQKIDDYQKRGRDQSDEKPKIPSKKRASSFGIPTDGEEPRRKSLSASLRRAFAPRATSRTSARQTKDALDWTAQQKYRRQSSIRQSLRRSTLNFKIAILRFPRQIWNLFFWLGRDDDEDSPEIILELRQLVICLIHLSLICSIFGITDYSGSYAAMVLSESITKTKFDSSFRNVGDGITFNDVRSVQDIWGFIYQVLLPVLFYPIDDESGDTHYVLISSVLIGAPQIRQIRVKNSTCIYHPIIEGLFETCYDYYSKENEDKEPFGLNTSAWMYKSDIEGDVYHGYISSYGGGGYVMNFTTFILTKAWLNELEENFWIRPGTRAVIISFSTASQNAYCVVKLAFELPPTGGVVTSSSFHSAKFNRFSDLWSFFTLSCELCLLVFTIYYTADLLKNAMSKNESTSNFWIYINLIIISLSYAVVILEAYLFSVTLGFQQTASAVHTIESVAFDGVFKHQIAYECCGKLLLCFAILKLFKFSSMNKSTRLISSAFDQVKFELLAMVMTAVVVTMGFAVLGISLFGFGTVQLRTLWEAFFSLLYLSVSSFHYYAKCIHVSKFGSYIFFPAYIAFIYLFFLNTCVALVVYGFLKAAEEMDSNQHRMYLEDAIEETALLILPLFSLYRLTDKLKDAQTIKRNAKEYDAFVRILLRYDWQWVEIRLFMKSHGLHRGEKLNFQQLTEAYDDFWVRNLLSLEVSGHNKIKGSIDKIENIMEYFETTLYDIRTKAEIVTDRKLPRKSRNLYFQQ